MSRRGWVLFAAVCVVWGLPYALIKVALEDLSPPVMVFGRTALAAVILLPLAARRGQLSALRGHWPMVCLFTVVEVGIPWLLLGHAETRLSSSLAGLLIAIVPLIGAVLARFSGTAERLDLHRMAGLLVGLGGVAALVGLDVGGSDIWAAVELGICSVGYALGPMIVSTRLRDLPDGAVIAASFGLCAVAYAPFAALSWPDHAPSGRSVASVVALALVCTITAFTLFFKLIAEVGPARATVVTYVNPAVALMIGVLFLDEHLTLGKALGFPLVLAGSVLATRPSRRKARDIPVVGQDRAVVSEAAGTTG